MNITSSQADTELCIDCKAINFDDVFSADYMLGISINGYRIVCPLRHIDDTRNGSCPLCEFLRSLRPTNPSSDHLFLRVRWAKSWIRYKEDLANIDLDTQTALRIVPYDTLLLDINVNTNIHTQDNQFMEPGTEESNNKIAARRVDDRVNFKLIRSWLRCCRQHHQSHCYAGLDGIRDIPGFRVIDCASRKIVRWVEILEDHDRSYTALSYLWGTDTSTETQDGRIPSPSPKVIEDAVTATIELGFKYLWVDKYCIPQHESALKVAQMKRMDDVYGCSAVTIIASAGNGPAYGLPGVSSTPRVPQKSVRVGSRTLIAINNDICKKIRDSKWNTRAWTLQEGLWSTRCLCFEDDQVYFQCNLMRRLESISIPPGTPQTANPATDINTSYLHGSGNRTSLFPINGIREGGDVVDAFRRYVTRHINYPSDGLQAFEGILRKAAMMTDPLYNVCGVFIRVFEEVNMTASLVVGLCWRVSLRAFRGMSVIKAWGISYPGPLRCRLFPSWSWVGLVGKSTEKGITFRQPWELSATSLASLSKYETQPLTQSIAMEYADGTTVLWESRYQDILLSAMTKEAPRILRVHGYTSDALLWKLPNGGCPDTKGPPSSKISHSSLRNLSDFWFEDGWIWSDRDRSYCILLLTWPVGIKFYSTDLTNDHLCSFADWLETDKGPSSPSPLRDEYSFRVIILGRSEDRLYFMVLTRVSRGKGYPDASYERVNVIARPLPPGLSPETSLEDLGPEFLRGWTVQETIIV